jgi:NAD(P)-dependent dehydrogenase (short-subunit alcohol dehydrogenase family)
LIIGATSGIGNQITQDLEKSHQLFITGRNQSKLDLLNNDMACVYLLDLNNENGFDVLLEKLPVLDGVVFCAGVTNHTPAKFIQQKHIEEVFNVNVLGVIKLVTILLKEKKIARYGSLVFLSSIATKFPYFGGSLYVASKMALEGFAKTLAIELSDKKIRVNCVSPAFVRTDMSQKVEDLSSEDTFEVFSKKHPFGVVEIKDVSNMVCHLLSDESISITGQVMQVGNFNSGLKM